MKTFRYTFLLFLFTSIFQLSAESEKAKNLDEASKGKVSSFLNSYLQNIGMGNAEKIGEFYSSSYQKTHGKKFLENLSKSGPIIPSKLRTLEIQGPKQVKDRIFVRWKLASEKDYSPWYILQPGGKHGFEIVDISNDVSID